MKEPTLDDLYQHRNLLFLALLYNRDLWNSRSFKTWKDHNGIKDDEWFLIGTELPTLLGLKQISYHIPANLWDLCWFLPEVERFPNFDGHTSDDVADSLKAFMLNNPENIKCRATPPVVLTDNPMQLSKDKRAPANPPATPRNLRTGQKKHWNL